MTPVEISVGASSYNWWDLIPAIVGGIIGALAGGVPAYMLAVRASRETSHKENEILLSQNRAKATRIFLGFLDLMNDVIGSLMQMEEMLSDLTASAELDPYRMQRRIRPLANIDYIEYKKFHYDDLSLLFENKKAKTAQDLVIHANQYNAVLNGLRIFRDVKREYFPFISDLPVADLALDGKVTSKVDNATLPKLRLQEAQMESVIVPIFESMRELVDDLLEIAPALEADLKSCFDDKRDLMSLDMDRITFLKGEVAKARSGLEYVTRIPLGI